LSEQKNGSREWWCESIWICPTLDDNGCAFGFSKLFRMIEDEDADTYMAFLDIAEIVKYCSETSRQLEVDWRFEIEDAVFGEVIGGLQTEQLKGSMAGFLNWFSVDLEALKSKSREQILAQWATR
jgi:hypothetical protein